MSFIHLVVITDVLPLSIVFLLFKTFCLAAYNHFEGIRIQGF